MSTFCIFLIVSALYLSDFGLRKLEVYRHETSTFMPPFWQKGAYFLPESYTMNHYVKQFDILHNHKGYMVTIVTVTVFSIRLSRFAIWS